MCSAVNMNFSMDNITHKNKNVVHDIIFAKVKGQPRWLAKIIYIDNNKIQKCYKI